MGARSSEGTCKAYMACEIDCRNEANNFLPVMRCFSASARNLASAMSAWQLWIVNAQLSHMLTKTAWVNIQSRNCLS